MSKRPKDSAEVGAAGGPEAIKTLRANMLATAIKPAGEDKGEESGPPKDRWPSADVEDAPDEPPRPTSGDQGQGGKPSTPTGPRKRARLIRASEVQARAIQWLWPEWIPFGMLTLLDGDPGLGKSTLTLDLVARVTRGDVMPTGSTWCNGGKPANAIVLMLEDAIAETIRPRLDAAGADCARVLVMTGIRDDDTDPDTERPPALPVDLGALREATLNTRRGSSSSILSWRTLAATPIVTRTRTSGAR